MLNLEFRIQSQSWEKNNSVSQHTADYRFSIEIGVLKPSPPISSQHAHNLFSHGLSTSSAPSLLLRLTTPVELQSQSANQSWLRLSTQKLYFLRGVLLCRLRLWHQSGTTPGCQCLLLPASGWRFYLLRDQLAGVNFLIAISWAASLRVTSNIETGGADTATKQVAPIQPPAAMSMGNKLTIFHYPPQFGWQEMYFYFSMTYKLNAVQFFHHCFFV